MTFPLFISALEPTRPKGPLPKNDIRRVIYPYDDVLWPCAEGQNEQTTDVRKKHETSLWRRAAFLLKMILSKPALATERLRGKLAAKLKMKSAQ